MTLLKVIALAISLAAPSSAALAASAPLYWTYGSRKQDEVARVQNKGGLSVLISCGSGNEGRNADIVIDLPDANIKKGTALTAQVVVSGKSFPFALLTEFAPHFLNVVRSASTNSEIQTFSARSIRFCRQVFQHSVPGNQASRRFHSSTPRMLSSAVMDSSSPRPAIPRPKHFPPKWPPVPRRKCGQNKDLEPVILGRAIQPITRQEQSTASRVGVEMERVLAGLRMLGRSSWHLQV